MTTKTNKILFLALNIFSATGGIEKVCRIIGKSVEDYCAKEGDQLEVRVLHDDKNAGQHNPYFDDKVLKSYAGNKLRFIYDAVDTGRNADVVVLSHINLLVVGWLIKKTNPSLKLVLIAHGIEIWDNVSTNKQKMLKKCDMLVAVSKFTKDCILEKKYVAEDKCIVINNCLDPLLPDPNSIHPTAQFYKKYGINPDNFNILTLTRLASSERYKGYDKIIKAIEYLKNKNFNYIIAGKSDEKEHRYLKELIQDEKLNGQVKLTGFIPDEDLPYLFKICDLYAMPSTKEGFGIVFIEAMYYGLPVLAGDKDGSVDALMSGRLGTLVDPYNQADILESLKKIIDNPTKNLPNKQLLMENFGYEVYCQRLWALLDNLKKAE